MVLEYDLLVLVNLLNQIASDLSQVGFVVDEIFYVVPLNVYGFFFASTEKTKVAHSMTHLTFPLRDSFAWKDSFPNCIIFFIPLQEKGSPDAQKC